MANDIDDIRIKDLPLAEDGIQPNDYIAVDNEDDGTRKATMQDIVEANVSGLETTATNTRGAINELKQRMTADESNITSLGTRISGAETDILGLKSVDNTLSDDIANTYDTTATYSVGDYAMYQKKLYICVTDVATPEPFDSNKWQAVKVSDDIREIKQSLSKLQVYSTAKFDTGRKWIDGRTIWGKVYTGTSLSNGTITLDTITLDTIVHAYGWTKSDNNNSWNIPSGRTDGYDNKWYYNTSTHVLAIQFGGSYANRPFNFTIEFVE